MENTKRIAMWSGPRNLSTAMMYSFAARSDCAVIDEPFYAAFLTHTGIEHPMQEVILASQPHEPNKVVEQCLDVIPLDKSLYYQKHMTHHMVEAFSLEWLSHLTNVFLIRHPARVIASYQQKRENPTLEDIGFVRQLEILRYVKDSLGQSPIVVDSDDILFNPGRVLSILCGAIGIDYQPQMLNWPSGGNAADGVWAPHWYQSVWKSKGLEATEKKPLPELDDDLNALMKRALPYYEEMASYKIST